MLTSLYSTIENSRSVWQCILDSFRLHRPQGRRDP